MFQKNTSKSSAEESNGRPRTERSESRSKREPSSGSASGTNVILSDVEIIGSVRFKNDVVIDGRIEGEIYSDGSVTIGEKASVKAEIRSKSVVVEGCVHGDIHATDRLELMEHAEVTGDISAAVLSMQAGAVLIGSSAVGAAPKREGSDHHGLRIARLDRDDEGHDSGAKREERELAHA